MTKHAKRIALTVLGGTVIVLAGWAAYAVLEEHQQAANRDAESRREDVALRELAGCMAQRASLEAKTVLAERFWGEWQAMPPDQSRTVLPSPGLALKASGVLEALKDACDPWKPLAAGDLPGGFGSRRFAHYGFSELSLTHSMVAFDGEFAELVSRHSARLEDKRRLLAAVHETSRGERSKADAWMLKP